MSCPSKLSYSHAPFSSGGVQNAGSAAQMSCLRSGKLPAALSSGQSTVLACGNDFYSSPRLDKDGARLAWVTWNHPNMPWCVTAGP